MLIYRAGGRSENLWEQEVLQAKGKTKTQCLASYLGDSGKFAMYFPVVFQASTGKKLQGKKHRKIHGIEKSDAIHFARFFLKERFVFNFGKTWWGGGLIAPHALIDSAGPE